MYMCTYVCTCVLMISLYPVCVCVVCVFFFSYRAVYLCLAHCVLCVLFHIHDYFSLKNWKCTHVTVPIAVHITLPMFIPFPAASPFVYIMFVCIQRYAPASLSTYIEVCKQVSSISAISLCTYFHPGMSIYSSVYTYTYPPPYLGTYILELICTYLAILATICTQPKHISTYSGVYGYTKTVIHDNKTIKMNKQIWHKDGTNKKNIYIYIYGHIHARINSPHKKSNRYMSICMYMCICVYIHVNIHTHIRMWLYLYAYICIYWHY